MLPLLFWYGGLAGIAGVSLLMLWALGLHALKRPAGAMAAVPIAAALVVASASSWALLRSGTLSHERQIHAVREPLNALIASGVYARASLEDVQAAADASPALNDLLSLGDRHEASIDALLEAEWQYHRAAAWDERGLLHKLTWDVADILVHHARWEKRDAALQCPAAPEIPTFSDLTADLQDRLQTHRVNAGAVGEQFEGFSFPDPEREGPSDAAVVRGVGLLLGGLALLAAGMAAFLWIAGGDSGSALRLTVRAGRGARPSASAQGVPGNVEGRDPRSPNAVTGAFSAAVLLAAALVLAGLSGWLVRGAGAERERLRAELYRHSVTVFREALALNDAVAKMSLAARAAPAPPRTTPSTLIADYAAYLNEISTLARLVRLWDRAVLTGVLEPDTVSSTRITTRSDLLNALRRSLLTAYRGYLRIAERIERLNCRSEWFSHPSGRPLEQALLMLPEQP